MPHQSEDHGEGAVTITPPKTSGMIAHIVMNVIDLDHEDVAIGRNHEPRPPWIMK